MRLTWGKLNANTSYLFHSVFRAWKQLIVGKNHETFATKGFGKQWDKHLSVSGLPKQENEYSKNRNGLSKQSIFLSLINIVLQTIP